MGGSLKVTEPWNGWGGRVLKGHRTMEYLGLVCPKRSQNNGMLWVGGSLQVTEPWNCFGGWVLKDHRTHGILGIGGS